MTDVSNCEKINEILKKKAYDILKTAKKKVKIRCCCGHPSCKEARVRSLMLSKEYKHKDRGTQIKWYVPEHYPEERE
jgi:hypothetical protein